MIKILKLFCMCIHYKEIEAKECNNIKTMMCANSINISFNVIISYLCSNRRLLQCLNIAVSYTIQQLYPIKNIEKNSSAFIIIIKEIIGPICYAIKFHYMLEIYYYEVIYW